MQESLQNTLLRLCKLFEKYAVQYIVVGGTSVALNGYYRHSMNVSGQLAEKPDIDIWYNPGYQNYFNLLKVLEELGQDVSAFKREQAPDPRKSFFRLDLERFL